MAGTGLMEFAGGLAAAAKLLKALKDLVTAPDARAQVSELYDVIIAAQAGALEMLAKERSMLEQIDELKGKLAAVEAWESEKLRYKLVRPVTGALVYALQRSMSNGEPPHYMCTNCYKQGKPSVLNDGPTRGNSHWYAWICPNCGAEARTQMAGPSVMKYAEELPAQ